MFIPKQEPEWAKLCGQFFILLGKLPREDRLEFIGTLITLLTEIKKLEIEIAKLEEHLDQCQKDGRNCRD